MSKNGYNRIAWTNIVLVWQYYKYFWDILPVILAGKYLLINTIGRVSRRYMPERQEK